MELDFADSISELSTCTTYTSFTYEKTDLHAMVWFGFFSWLLPTALYRVLDGRDYYEEYGLVKDPNPITDLWIPTDTSH